MAYDESLTCALVLGSHPDLMLGVRDSWQKLVVSWLPRWFRAVGDVVFERRRDDTCQLVANTWA